MGRKHRRVVVTVTETWTFVFDETGTTPDPTPLFDLPALASIPAPPVDDALVTPDASDALIVDAPENSRAAGDDV